MLEASARYLGDDLVVTVPGCGELAVGKALDSALSSWLDRSARLVDALAHGPGTFECPTEFEDDESEVVRWTGIGGSFVDESELHLLSTGDLDRLADERPDICWDVRRFRPNIVVDGGPDAFSSTSENTRYRVGDAEVAYEKGCTRCVMTTRSQPAGIERQLDVLRHVVRAHANVVGVRARIVSGGRVRVGDSLSGPGPRTEGF